MVFLGIFFKNILSLLLLHFAVRLFNPSHWQPFSTTFGMEMEDWKMLNSYKFCQNFQLGRKFSPSASDVIPEKGTEMTLPIPWACLESDRLLPGSNTHALNSRHSCLIHWSLPRQHDKRRKLEDILGSVRGNLGTVEENKGTVGRN